MGRRIQKPGMVNHRCVSNRKAQRYRGVGLVMAEKTVPSWEEMK